jgi:hypothetical protein
MGDALAALLAGGAVDIKPRGEHHRAAGCPVGGAIRRPSGAVRVALTILLLDGGPTRAQP